MQPEKKKMPVFSLNGTQLKHIAMVSMALDHTGVALFFRGPAVIFEGLRFLGRLAFPIYCFLLVEGFVHTGSRRRYAISLFLAALISEIPYNLASAGSLLAPELQNVYFTLFLGLLALAAAEWGERTGRRLLSMALCAGIMGAAYLLQSDYDAAGIILILVFWFVREDEKMRHLGPALILLTFGWPGLFAVLAVPLLMRYNGERGKVRHKYAYYLFYPAHLLLLGLLRTLFLS